MGRASSTIRRTAAAAYLRDLVGNDRGLGLDDGHDIADDLLGLGACVLGRVRSLGLLAVALLGENNQVRLVLTQTSHVLAKRLLRAVLAAEVNRDADSARLLAVHLGLLELLEREPLASTLLHVVADSLAVHNRAQQAIDGAGEILDPPPVS